MMIIPRGPHLHLLLLSLILAAHGTLARAESLSTRTEAGPVVANVALEPSEPLIGDAVRLSITVTAEPGVELLMPEFGEALEAFTIIDFVPRESIDDEGRTIATQTYRLQTSSSGPQLIPPILIEFVDRRPGQRPAPEGLDAYELLTDALEFHVKSVLPENAAAELKPPLGELPPRDRSPRSPMIWLAVGIAFTSLAAALAVYLMRGLRRRARRRSAFEIASARLEALLSAPRPTADTIDAFYVELSAIVRRYLEDRFDLRAPELTTEEFLAAAGESDVLSRDHQALLQELLRQADLVKFAGFKPASDDVERSLDAARRFLEETREDTPLVVENHSARRREEQDMPIH